MKTLGIALLAALLPTTSLSAPAPAALPASPAAMPAAEDAAAAAFQRMQNLAGSWKLQAPNNPRQQAFRITFRGISGNSAVVEDFGNPAGQITETIYHLDGRRLMATHYCAQGNQPRLRLVHGSADGLLEFAFFDATNLPDANASHLVRLQLRLIDAKHLEKREVYVANGKEEVTTYLLERAE